MDIYDLDTSVLLEIIFEGLKQTKARKLFQLSTYSDRYLLHISTLTLGEALLILEAEENLQLRHRFFLEFFTLLTSYSVRIYIPPVDSFISLLIHLRRIDPYLSENDSMILASAFANNTKTFFTLDRQVLASKRLEQEFSLTICEP